MQVRLGPRQVKHMGIELLEASVTPASWTKTYYGSDTRELIGDKEIKIQFTGPQSEVVLQEGPPAGKKWRVFTQIHVSESDI